MQAGASREARTGARVSARLDSIDAVRGAVMIIMALDHTRDFVHSAASQFRPEDLARTTPAIFLTRWITHFCAPVFVFYAGMSAFLWMQRGRAKGELARFLVTRGLWLILLEITAVHFAMRFNLRYDFVILTVLWAIGWSMIALSVLAFLPGRVLAAVSVAVIALHNATDGVMAATLGRGAWLWNVLHQPGALRVAGATIVPAYSLVPWVFVLSAGFCFAPAFLRPPDERRRLLIRFGIALSVLFVVLRALNVYGDPAPWARQASAAMTFLSFLNCTKYPPSLLFLLMTLGPALLATAWMDRLRLSDRNPLIVFGRTPLFYFVGHFLLMHALAALLVWVRTGNPNLFWNPSPAAGGPAQAFPPPFGFDLWVVYAVWIVVVALMYPLCAWFAGVKKRRRDWWLSYL